MLIVSGIWPPDVGGPASHAPEVAEFLQRPRARGRGADDRASAPPAPRPYPVRWVPRRLAGGRAGTRTARCSPRAAARRADVVYSTGMIGRTRVGTLLGRRPAVVKLTGDPAYERALRYGLTTVPLDEFQCARGGRIARAQGGPGRGAQRRRASTCARAESLRQIASSWRPLSPGADPRAAEPGLPSPGSPTREELRRRHGFSGLDARRRRAGSCRRRRSASRSGARGLRRRRARRSPATGPSARGWRRSQRELPVRFLGAQPRGTVFELLAAADAVLLSSSWENFPHAVVEGLAAGTPVIATERRRASPEIVQRRRERAARPARRPVGARRGDPPPRRRRGAARAAARGGARSVAGYAPERVYARLEALLLEAAG